MNRRLVTVTAVLFVVGVLLDLLVGYSPFPGYGAGIGLFGCIALVLFSKWVGRVLLDRPEDYYPDDVVEEPQRDLLPADHPDARPGLPHSHPGHPPSHPGPEGSVDA